MFFSKELLLFILIVLLFSCQEKEPTLNTSEIDCVQDYPYQEDLEYAQKLINSFRLEDARAHLERVLQNIPRISEESEFIFLCERLNHAFSKYAPLKQINPSLEDVKLNSSRDSIVHLLIDLYKWKFEKIDSLTPHLSRLEEDKCNDFELLLRCYLILTEYFQSEKYNEHNAIKYAEKILAISNQKKKYSGYYLSALENLVKLELINRDEHKARAYAKMYSEYSKQFLDNQILQSRALRLEGLTLYYLDQPQRALKSLFKALQLLPKTLCLFDKQEILKIVLFICNNIEDWGLYEKYLKILETEIDSCGDFCNLNKLKGVNAIKKGKINQAIPYLLDAYKFIIIKKPIDNPQFGSIIYYLHSAYLSNKNYDKALDVYYSETVDPLPLQIQKWDKEKIFDNIKKQSTFYFMTIGFYANVFFEKYRDRGNIQDLLYAKELIDSSRVLIKNETEVINEDRLLSVFQYAENVNDLGRLINAHLFEVYNEKQYIEDFSLFSEASKSSLSYALVQCAERKGLKIQQSIDSILLNNENSESLLDLKNELKDLSIPFRSLNEKGLLGKIQSSMSENEVLIDYNIIQDKLFIHYVYSDSTSLHEIPYNDHKYNVDHLIELQKNEKSKIDQLKNCARKVFLALFPDSSLPYRVTIIPDKHLADLSFDLLIDTEDRYLIDHHLISYSGSGAQFMSSNNADIIDNADVAAFFFTDNRSLLDAQHTLDELPGNINEKAIIKSMCKGAQIFSGAKHTRDTFLKTIVDSNYDIIHVATHGYASKEDIKDLRLYFRNSNYTLDSIYAYHILDKQIKANLVILSACHSGVGKFVQGEGKFDWNRYFLLSGANSVISSLWEVNDRASKLIFNNFYISKQRSKAEKIREAKARLKNNPNYSHPFYWSGFIYSV